MDNIELSLNIHWKDWCWSWIYNNLATWYKSRIIGKDPNAGDDWRQEEKGMTEDEMVGWNHWFNGREFEQTWEIEKDRKAWCAAVHGVRKSQTWLGGGTTTIVNINIRGERKRKRSRSVIYSNIKAYVHPNISAQTPISNCLLSFSSCMSSLCLTCYRSKMELLLFVHTCPSSLFPILVHDSPIFLFDQATNLTHHPSGYSPKSS